MPEFIYIDCPQCRVKIKIDREKKYHDCPECGLEFRSDQLSLPEKAAPGGSLLEKLTKLHSAAESD
ncbi:MAG: hypothetical protein LBQ83_02965 [Candidatus Margulisbacteria bacterium]|nr:hypothetical protein [Candidatus Margulisiibacteriota bacterium]